MSTGKHNATRVLALLSERGQMTADEIMSALNISHAALTHAISALRASGLVWTVTTEHPCKYELSGKTANLWSDAT